MASPNAPRPPDPRKERARENRRRMVHAAYKLFVERGVNAPMTAIAEEAGVAVQTLYFTFHNKNTLLMEAGDWAVAGDNPSEFPPRELIEGLIADPDPRQVISTLVDMNLEIYPRVAPLHAAMRALADDPEIIEFLATRERWRAENFARFVDMMVAKPGGLREGMDRQTATDLLLLVAGEPVFAYLIDGRGWSRERIRAWAIQTLEDQLLPPARATRARAKRPAPTR